MTECVNSPYFIWRIQHFTSVQRKVSPALFSIGLAWQLRFSRFTDDDGENIRLTLECLNATETVSSFEFRTSVYFVNDDGTRTLLRNAKHSLKDKEYYVWTEISTQVQKSFINYFGCMTFGVTITPVGGFKILCKHQMNGKESYPNSLCISSLIGDFEKLFNNNENSDFVLKCGEKCFYVHKAVLTARSDFFSGMFRSNMKEVTEGFCKIEDIESDILELVLRYLYTGEIQELPKKSLQKIYAAADRFGVESLKVRCYLLFVDNLVSPEENKNQTSNVNKSTKVVETRSQVSIKENKLLKDLFESREWRSYSLEFPEKAQEVFRSYFFKN